MTIENIDNKIKSIRFDPSGNFLVNILIISYSTELL